MRVGSLIVFGMVLSGGTALAKGTTAGATAATTAAPAPAPAQAAGPPAPAPELKAMGSWFVGNWTCESKWNESPMGPAHAAKGAATVTWGPGNFWIVSNYKETKSKENPMPWDVRETFGFDATTKQFTRVAFDNFGGWSNASATREGDNLVYSGEAISAMGKMPMKATFSKKSDKELTFAFVFTGKSGPMDVGGGTCKK